MTGNMRPVRHLAPLLFALGCTSTGGVLIQPDPTPSEPTPEPTPEDLDEPDDDPVFDPPGQTFESVFTLTMASDPAGYPILFTEDGSVPFLDSTIFEEGIPIRESTRFYAQVDYEFPPDDEGVVPEPDVNTHSYFRLDNGLAEETSNIPVVLVHTFETGNIERDEYDFQPAHAMIFEPDEDGVVAILGTPTIDTPIGIKIRGSSTRNQEKQSYRVELRDAHGEDDSYVFGGLAKESDWIFFAPLRFDQAYVRNPLAYEMSRRMGRWAPRTRNIELYLIDNRDARFRPTDYLGVYTLIEKIKPDVNRLAIHKMTPEHNALPELSGGYVFKVDRTAPGDNGFIAGGSADAGRALNMVYPDPDEITSAQQGYLIDYIDTFAAALNAGDFHHPTLGTHYSEYIDVDGWIDHHIVNLFTRNPDGLRLSSYFHKPRNGKLIAGPVWDFDRTMGSRDGRDEDPDSWLQGNGNGFFTALWWGRLFEDPEFSAAYWVRVDELVNGIWSASEMSAMVDELSADLEDGAALRNFGRWSDYQHPGGWPTAVEHLRWWVTTRSDWLVDNINDHP